MSIRLMATVGAALCIAVTSFSIYLGVAEHVYHRQTVHAYVLHEETKYRSVCFTSTARDATSTSSSGALSVTFC